MSLIRKKKKSQPCKENVQKGFRDLEVLQIACGDLSLYFDLPLKNRYCNFIFVRGFFYEKTSDLTFDLSWRCPRGLERTTEEPLQTWHGRKMQITNYLRRQFNRLSGLKPDLDSDSLIFDLGFGFKNEIRLNL